jgi:hypothetical protein
VSPHLHTSVLRGFGDSFSMFGEDCIQAIRGVLNAVGQPPYASNSFCSSSFICAALVAALPA